MLTLHPEIIHANGVSRTKIIARNDSGDIVHADVLTLESLPSRRRVATALSEKTGESADYFDRELLRLLNEKPPTAHAAKDNRQRLLEDMPKDVRQDAADLLQRPTLVEEIRSDLGAIGVAGNRDIAFATYVIGTSRLLKRPLAGIVKGATSSGKSFEITTPAALFPPETKLEAHHLTPKALYYLDENALVHCFVVAGERSKRQDDEAADATKALREMLSDGVLRCAVTENINGKMKTSTFERKGPIAFIESTSAAKIFPEDLNRCLLLPADESQEQTEAIIEAAAKVAAESLPDLASGIIQTHHALQRMLRPLNVVVPFATLLGEKFPKTRVEARRIFPHLLNAVRAVALLHQQQRQDKNGVICAHARDYEIAVDVITPTMRHLNGSVDCLATRVWDAIKSKFHDEEEFTRNRVASLAGICDSDAGGRLRILTERGYLIETQEHRGNKPAKFKINPEAPDEEPSATVDLPSVEAVEEACGTSGVG